jgi:hypothetical protein
MAAGQHRSALGRAGEVVGGVLAYAILAWLLWMAWYLYSTNVDGYDYHWQNLLNPRYQVTSGPPAAPVLPLPTYTPWQPGDPVPNTYWYCWDSGAPSPHHEGHPLSNDHLCTPQELAAAGVPQ